MLHKQALAVVHYVVEIWVDPNPAGGGDEFPLTGATVQMKFSTVGNWIDADELQNGKYEVIRNNYEGHWEILISNPPGLWGLAPEGNPINGSASHAYQFWWVW